MPIVENVLRIAHNEAWDKHCPFHNFHKGHCVGENCMAWISLDEENEKGEIQRTFGGRCGLVNFPNFVNYANPSCAPE